MPRLLPCPHWLLLLGIAALGLALRLAAARGGLWLDEAWSVASAVEVGTPIGVFVRIHHDNNHHLNSLWLQLVGGGAHPIVQRGLSILCGTAAIPLAGMILADRGRTASIVAATLFAVSPILVTYGSEARGYAPMLLAFLLLVLFVQRWLQTGARARVPVIGLGLLSLAGTLAQMTMIFGICALTGWVAMRRWSEAGARTAIVDTARAMASPVIVAAATIWIVVRGLPGPGGFRFGSYQPFRLDDLRVGQTDMLSYTLGLPPGPAVAVLGIGIAIVSLALLPTVRDRRVFYVLAIVGLPVGCVVISLGNVSIARYFLIGAVALLLLVAESGAAGVRSSGARRVVAVCGLAAALGGSIATDMRLLFSLRADPSAAVGAMRARAPDGATITLDRDRAAPIVRLASERAAYPVRIAPCGRYLFVDRDGAEPFPARPMRCGRSYVAIAAARAIGLSGSHWTLYERRP